MGTSSAAAAGTFADYLVHLPLADSNAYTASTIGISMPVLAGASAPVR